MIESQKGEMYTYSKNELNDKEYKVRLVDT